MNDEKLIELVRQNTALYDFENSKHSDNNYRDKSWSAIAKELNVALGSTCKSRWNQLRDQWRKNKKNHVTKSGQANKPVKKWRYEEQMSFLEPFVRQRETIGNLNDPNDIEEEETETQENTAITETQANTTVTESERNASEATGIPGTATEFTPTCKKQRFSSNIKQVSKLKKDEPASSQLMKYLIEKQQREETGRSAAKDPTDLFFESIAGKVKCFTPYYRNIAESRIFTLVQELELEHLLQTQGRPQERFRQQYPNNNNNAFQNDVPSIQLRYVRSPSPSPASSASTAASYLATFSYNDGHCDNN